MFVEPLVTNVTESPSQDLVTLEIAKSWLGLTGNSEYDSDIERLISEVSDKLCGVNADTLICFREWILEDIWYKNTFPNDYPIPIWFPRLTGIKNIKFGDSSQEEIPADQYEIVFRGFRKSFVIIKEIPKDQNILITYKSGNYNDIPKRLILAAKMAIFDTFRNRGSTIDGNFKKNPEYTRLLQQYIL